MLPLACRGGVGKTTLVEQLMTSEYLANQDNSYFAGTPSSQFLVYQVAGYYVTMERASCGTL